MSRHTSSWSWAIALLLAGSLASWVWAIHEVAELERVVQAAPGPSLVVVRPAPALRDDLDACHRRIDAIDAVITAIEARRGNEPPRILAEQRAYRGQAMAPFKAGKPEVSK